MRAIGRRMGVDRKAVQAALAIDSCLLVWARVTPPPSPGTDPRWSP